jgi:TatD DNase family protein
MHYIDTHSHLFLKEFDEDRGAVYNRAMNAGVHQMILPNVDSSSLEILLAVCRQFHEHCYPAIGVHPCSIKENWQEELGIHEEVLQKVKVKAIGEIGIDLYWDKTFIKEQELALETQIKWALKNNLPVILHCRESMDRVLEIVSGYKSLTGVFHAFNGTTQQAQRVIDMGFYLGIGGVVTFKNGGIDKALAPLNLEKVVLETDAPYLTPTPHRGKRNESSYIPIIAGKLAEIFNVDVKKVAEITSQNAVNLFKL